jgi:hypothetical protein
MLQHIRALLPIFWRKKSEISVKVITDFCSIRGSGGYALCKLIFSKFLLEEIWGKWECVMTHSVLAVLLQIARREFACCTSLGECVTTHKGVPAHFLDSLWLSTCCASLGEYVTTHKGVSARLPDSL